MARGIIFYIGFWILACIQAVAQIVTTNPAFPTADKPITITVDVTGTSLNSFAWDNTTNPVYIWAWVKKAGSPDTDAPTNVNPATAAQAAAKCTRIGTNPDKYQITFTPTVFFNKPAADIQRMGLKLKSKDWGENKQTDVDKFIDFSSGFNASFATPTLSSFLKNNGDQFPITVNTSENATITLKINGSTVSSQIGATILTYNHTVTETSGTTQVVAEAVAGSQSKTISFSYTIRSATINQARPIGIKDGINYSNDPTKATLSLWAPGKSSVYLMGDFTNWDLNASYQMKKDGEHFWLEVSGLTSGTEYAFQYLVEESLRMADPYADKILDPDDSFIPTATYPSLKTFPTKAVSDKWYFNRAAVLQTGQSAYQWQITNFQKPSKEKLVIYELLVRDFFGSSARNYQSLIDTLSYLKRLGVNAIELMPVTEFNGNEGWGYNPTFMFAPDKYYGTKNKLKEFIDKCHAKGIAVILDMVMNHHDLPNPYVMMDFDFTAFKPTGNNKWFNTDAKHPFNVFFDMNHESAYTKKYLDSINYYWLNEYKVDGYRYDLSKGFTQVNNPSNVNAWGAYDASRIAILKRMSDKIWSHTPNAYVILEHFADNTEEKELSEYRANEGKGMMLWANFNNSYNQSTMGFAGSSDIGNIYFTNRSWTVPHGVGYMESHDEERLMYKNLQFGNSNANYNVKSINTALERMKGAGVVFYTIPGPKMLWQFGELGYDLSINTCSDGTVNNNCRISNKPVKWEYLQDPNRVGLFNVTADLIRLRNAHTVFTLGDATVTQGNLLVKQVVVKNKPYNASPNSESQMNVVAITNFDIVKQTAAINFPHTGTWFDYYASGENLNVNTTPFNLDLLPGQYKIFTDVKIESPAISLAPVTGVEDGQGLNIELYPNPLNNILKIDGSDAIESIFLVSMQGVKTAPIKIDSYSWDVSSFSSGVYVVEVKTDRSLARKKIIKY
jgi:pullulanase/glycogen debranching enzyme